MTKNNAEQESNRYIGGKKLAQSGHLRLERRFGHGIGGHERNPSQDKLVTAVCVVRVSRASA